MEIRRKYRQAFSDALELTTNSVGKCCFDGVPTEFSFSFAMFLLLYMKIMLDVIPRQRNYISKVINPKHIIRIFYQTRKISWRIKKSKWNKFDFWTMFQVSSWIYYPPIHSESMSITLKYVINKTCKMWSSFTW